MKSTTVETAINQKYHQLQEQPTKLQKRTVQTRTQLVAQWLVDKHSKLHCRWVKT